MTILARCELTEMSVDHCACENCWPEPSIGPVFNALYRGECSECDTHIDPGDKIRLVDGETVHEGCEPG